MESTAGEQHLDKQLQELAERHGFVRPDRGDLGDPSIPWRNGKPDYRKADLQYFKGKTMDHKPGSLELAVENLVKKWEMEASHLPDYKTWTAIDPERYQVQTNGGKIFSGEESSKIGNYNWLLEPVSKELYDPDQHTFESSHVVFRGAFPDGFPWEVLKVFSGPPRVAFTWRHWATFNGDYKGRTGEGQTVEMHGFAVVTVDDKMRVCQIEAFYNPEEFLKALEGEIPASDLRLGKDILGSGCPIHQKR